MIEILFWSIGAPMGYLTTAGFVHKKVSAYLRGPGNRMFNTQDGDSCAAFFAAAFWPAAAPVAVGRWLAGFEVKNEELNRKQRKQIQNAKFMAEVAKHRLEEAKTLKAAEEANPLSIRHGRREIDFGK